MRNKYIYRENFNSKDDCLEKRIFFYGDSNTWGYIPFGGRMADNDRFPLQAGLLLPGFTIVECGLNGRCSAYSHAIFPDELLGGATFKDEFCKALPVTALVLMLGTNDVMDPLNFSAKTIADNMRRMIREARLIASHIPVLLISPPAIAKRNLWELVGLNRCDKNLLEQHLAPELAQVAQAEGVNFLDARDSVDEFHADDGMHLNRADHHALGKACGEALQAMLLGL